MIAGQTGGAGGGGYAGASGAAGASSTLANVVSGVTTGGTLALTENAVGGHGGYSAGGTAGAGGAGSSSLTLNDLANATKSASITGTIDASGGAGGRAPLSAPVRVVAASATQKCFRGSRNQCAQHRNRKVRAAPTVPPGNGAVGGARRRPAPPRPVRRPAPIRSTASRSCRAARAASSRVRFRVAQVARPPAAAVRRWRPPRLEAAPMRSYVRETGGRRRSGIGCGP